MDTEPTADRPYVIEDWMGRRIFPTETFATFEDARDRISTFANDTVVGETDEERERDYNGICEDLYAENRYEEDEESLLDGEAQELGWPPFN